MPGCMAGTSTRQRLCGKMSTLWPMAQHIHDAKSVKAGKMQY